ncbi:LOW QUALITY PROTEIN: syntaxin-6 [Egretta garzetta]|uniref:LOW QUALITY PROTEIN: syntaxin-6 n=1 Tax=Egretta garzetta TaxID=188379 RepID=UPI00163C602D|nr:LOW QUALITY PROTEIN: syntaxin-6 [Egretta garzetta]
MGTEQSLTPISAQRGDFESRQGGAAVDTISQQSCYPGPSFGHLVLYLAWEADCMMEPRAPARSSGDMGITRNTYGALHCYEPTRGYGYSMKPVLVRQQRAHKRQQQEESHDHRKELRKDVWEKAVLPCSAGHGAVLPWLLQSLMIILLLLFNRPGCREVQKAVNTAQGLFQRWTELLQDPSIATREEIDWTTNELRNNLRSIEWDLEDLDETISIVEANPRKFNLDATELGIRKAFITSTRQVVREMKDQMSNSSMQTLAERKNRQALLGESGSQSWSSGPDKYSRLDRELQLANSHFIEEQQAQQQLIVEQQDEQLELVSGSIGVLKNMSQRIGGELEEQAVMLDDFSHELDSTQSRLDNVMKKLAKVSHMTSDRRQWCAIIVLFVILLVVLILFFVL